ncbi:MAG: hypothetical protein HWE13_05800, partial [Gammaproteobacteria bacterium]|nr:hypothetical protein [Gammaproteobacteria bacterium]
MNFWRTLSLVGIVTILTLLMGCVSKVSSIKLDQDALSDPNEGYLLLGINSDVSLTSIEISGPKNIKLTSADLREGSRYILVDLPKGRYNIEQVRQDTWRGYLRV